ncbi:hypothetical protein NPIL_233491 [Nephila pilipes]|uniref:Uncharacterized protein n=1 Tax=Nephila pilipes TaxID=299642 RepID=A0A8X6NCR5_NEPPI|nr:hypothetical protein NPIL_233491 [Nephila pilipes]
MTSMSIAQMHEAMDSSCQQGALPMIENGIIFWGHIYEIEALVVLTSFFADQHYRSILENYVLPFVRHQLPTGDLVLNKTMSCTITFKLYTNGPNNPVLRSICFPVPLD